MFFVLLIVISFAGELVNKGYAKCALAVLAGFAIFYLGDHWLDNKGENNRSL